MMLRTQTTGLAICSVILSLMAFQPVFAEPGDIVLGRDVPPQRFDVMRHTGQPTIINPSPAQETDAIHGLVTGGLVNITELSDLQTSGITSNLGLSLGVMPSAQMNNQIIDQISSTNARGSLGGAMGGMHGITSGIGKSVGSSVGGATQAATGLIRDVLTGTDFGSQP